MAAELTAVEQLVLAGWIRWENDLDQIDLEGVGKFRNFHVNSIWFI